MKTLVGNIDYHLKAKNMAKSFCKRWYVFISGLPNAKIGEMVSFVNKNLFAMVLESEANK